MSWYKIYRFPLLVIISWVVFFLFLFLNLKKATVISLARKDIHIQKKSSGTYGKFSFTLNISDVQKKNDYSRSFKNFCLSNLFFNLEKIEKADSIYLAISADQFSVIKQNKRLYYITDHRPNALEKIAQIISYIINNQTLYLAIPLVLTFVFCADEFKKDFRYINNLHKKLSNASYVLIGIFILLITIY